MSRCCLLLSMTAMMFAAALSTGCAEERSLDGRGQACISDDGAYPDYFPDFDSNPVVYVVVRLDECLSSSCHTDMFASCTVTLEGDRLIIESEGGYTDESGAGSSCTTDCVTLDAMCQTNSTIPDGTYTVVYGDDEFSFTIPGPAGVYCTP